MNLRICALLLLWPLPPGLLTAQTAKEQARRLKPPPGLVHIDKEDLLERAGFLASDNLGGRLTGSLGQKMAADYIAKHFRDLGLEPFGDMAKGKRQWFQRYGVTRTYLDPQATWIRLEIEAGKANGGKRKRDLVEFSAGFAVLPAKRSRKLETEGTLVFAGAVGGRRGGRVKVAELAGQIPVVLLKTRSLKQRPTVEQQFGIAFFSLGQMGRRANALARAEAEVVIFCLLDDDSALGNALSYFSLSPGKPLVSKPGSVDMSSMAGAFQGKVPWVITSRKLSLKILEAMGLGEDVMGKKMPVAGRGELPKPKARIALRVRKDSKAMASNVVAILRGTDPVLRKQAVVYSAHMDHLGKRMDQDVFNGADDNASGTSGLMEIAEAFAKTAKTSPPRRSVIFLAVSGEELGLWGSAHFVKNSPWPLEDIVANINTDMIGRNGPESGANEIMVTPSYRNRKFSTIVQDAVRIGRQMGISFRNGDKYYSRSDHFNFARKGIPVVFFCNGVHEDYHQVSDHADLLDGEKMERIARLAYWTGYMLAQASDRPEELGRRDDWLPETGR